PSSLLDRAKILGARFVGCNRSWRSGRNVVPHPIKEAPLPVRKFKVRHYPGLRSKEQKKSPSRVPGLQGQGVEPRAIGRASRPPDRIPSSEIKNATWWVWPLPRRFFGPRGTRGWGSAKIKGSTPCTASYALPPIRRPWDVHQVLILRLPKRSASIGLRWSECGAGIIRAFRPSATRL